MGKKIELKATGETITFTKSTVETNGAFVKTLVTLPASGEGPPTHRHVHQTELFEAVEGKLGLECDGNKIVLHPGESFTVPSNTLHKCYAVDGTEIKFEATFTPALSIEYVLCEMFDACNRQNSKDPSIFDACFILQQTKGEYYLGDVPVFIQKTVFPLTAALGKLLGLIKAKSKSE